DQSFSFEIRASDFIAGLVQTEHFGYFIACFHIDIVFVDGGVDGGVPQQANLAQIREKASDNIVEIA
ncbi:hypothetical protein, partial [Duncaniella sp.]|uniref:hypothetical protein n=1 Tax=Duncaniella sp. TaxID=2518496 RepID=UPI0023D02571